MFWMTLGKGILKRPWIIALIVMTLAMGAQWVKINSLKGDVVGLRADVVKIQADFKTCKVNEVTLEDVNDQCVTETSEFKDNISLLTDQLRIEKDRVVMWRDKYNNKVCYNSTDEVVVIKKDKPDQVRVLNDEKNADAINRINGIFNN